MTIITNNLFFSNTYLRQLQGNASRDQEAGNVAQGIRDWIEFRDMASLPALIDSWVGPVLDFLQLSYMPATDDTHILVLGSSATPLGLCYVLGPGEALDGTTKGQHPMAQAVLALRRRGLRWGILTDGPRWRLVDAEATRRYEQYLEVNLDALAQTEDLTPLRVFFACFRRDAFAPNAHGTPGLEQLLETSAKATKAAEDHLKSRVSHNEGIMAQLCLGLVRATGKQHFSEEERDEIYRDATYLLYRLLFLLYAEARGLLPMDNPAYAEASLTRLVLMAHEYQSRGMPDPEATTLWQRLQRLSTAIYESDQELDIPAYNGGLFDDSDKPYLRERSIADTYLARALYDLAYMAEAAGTDERIDYRDLSVRHLGSLYEGMIEYRLFVAETPVVARRDAKGIVHYLPEAEAGVVKRTDQVIEVGDVYFGQSAGERRATGTYYTPEYIVEYIVRQTVWRGLEERWAGLEERLQGWLRELEATTDVGDRARMQRTIDESLTRFVENEVLSFRVCDPAMGSGHFLVNTAHQITAFIVETLHMTPWANGRVVTDPVQWRRRVSEHCLYGVDLNPIAVELAKLSLWIATLAEGKPLSFLNHHLRQGNSLIGARLEDLTKALAEKTPARPSKRETRERAAGQISMMDDPAFSEHLTAALDLMARIEERVAGTVADVKAQAADYEQMREELEPYRKLANVLVARHFGAYVADEQLHTIGSYLTNGSLALAPRSENVLQQAQQQADEHSFFHWELEFPEVFFDSDSNDNLERQSEFDVIIGNPPYVSFYSRESIKTSPLAEQYWADKFGDSVGGRQNTFLLFLIQSLKLKSSHGYVSMIVPDTLTNNDSYERTRRSLTVTGLAIVNRLDYNVFDGPTVHTVIPVLTTKSNDIEFMTFSSTEDFVSSRPTSRTIMNHSDVIKRHLCKWPFGSESIDDILHKMIACSVPMQSIATTKDGVNPGPKSFREQILAPQGSPKYTWRPLIEGRHITRYRIEPPTNIIDYDPNLLTPELRKQGASFRNPEVFDAPKLVNRQTANTLIFALDDAGYCTLNSVHNTRAIDGSRTTLLYLLAVLNSKLLRFYYRQHTQETRKVFPQVHISALRQLPIHQPNLDEPVEREHYRRLVELSERMLMLHTEFVRSDNNVDETAHQAQIADIDQEIDRIVYTVYGLGEEQVAVVESAMQEATL
jgi:hypothetical protein